MNYVALQERIIDWSNRTDLATRIPEFISLAESEIKRRITTKKQSVRALLECVSGQSYYCLPDDYKAMRDIQVNYNGRSASLRNAAPSTVNGLTKPAVPLFYTDIAQQLQLIPPPDSDDYVIEMVYYRDLPKLADQDDSDGGTNWLLTQDEDIYLNGAMKYLSIFIKDYETAALWDGPFQISIEALEGADHEDRWSGPSMEVMNG